LKGERYKLNEVFIVKAKFCTRSRYLSGPFD